MRESIGGSIQLYQPSGFLVDGSSDELKGSGVVVSSLFVSAPRTASVRKFLNKGGGAI